jgi:hypothetical protein
MGTIDYGTQTITFQYQEEATSKAFNNLNYLILPTGIYGGGVLSKEDANLVSISSAQFIIKDSTTETSVRVSTASSVNIEVSSGTPYLILRWNYSSSVNNYVDFLSSTYDDIQSDDLIIGRCIYKGGLLQEEFDYTRRSKSYLGTLNSDNEELKVKTTEPYSDKVYIAGGEIYGENGVITVSSGESPAISDTTLGRIDLVYIDDDGSIGIIEGADAASPSKPNNEGKFIIAVISRGASSTYITGDDISQVSIIRRYLKANDIPVEDESGQFSSGNLEDVLTEVGNDLTTHANSDLEDVHNVTISTSGPSGGSDGDIWFTRES